jgi:predicted O-methyltransferase YrrM
MRIFPKIKQIYIIYKLKKIIKNIKDFFYNLLFLIKNKTPLNILIKFIKSHFLKKDDLKSNFYNHTIFTESDWFSSGISIFNKFMQNEKNFVRNILEIGSYEGRSAIFFLNYFNASKITCVDTWLGSHEHVRKMEEIEKNFDNNLKLYENKLIKHKTTSDNFFLTNKLLFDLIYIDGLHAYDQVKSDLENAYKFLRPKGYLLIDDYLWKFYPINKKNVINSANEFIQKYNNNLELIYISEQVLLKKKGI